MMKNETENEAIAEAIEELKMAREDASGAACMEYDWDATAAARWVETCEARVALLKSAARVGLTWETKG